MTAPVVKGWCPGALRPMQSGDGLVVRVRPFRAEVTRNQAFALCDISDKFGNGVLDLTSRANVQIRGVREASHPDVISALAALDLLDQSEKVERHRNILMPFDWQQDDLTYQLHDAIVSILPDLPDLPGKMGFALDTTGILQLQDASADFRIEGINDQVILRADGSDRGWPLDGDTSQVTDAIKEMAHWFVETGGMRAGRMARHLATGARLPEAWCATPGASAASGSLIGWHDQAQIVGIPFGKLETDALRIALTESKAESIRLMTKRRLAFLNGTGLSSGPFIFEPDHPLMSAHACPGAPFCPQASVSTLDLARQLAPRVKGGLHVSGCVKGCAHAKPASITLVGRDGSFDLVRNGTTCDTPQVTQISPTEISAMIETF